MALSPINISRVSHTMRTDLIVDSLRRTQRDLFLSQSRIASGRSFVSASEDPIAASRALDLTQALQQQRQFTANLRYADNFLSAADSALVEINDLLIQASSIASQTVGSLTTEAERASEAEVIARLRQQLQTVANRTVGDRYIFAGRDTSDRPFIDANGGIAYVGDVVELFTRADQGLLSPFSMPGNEVFGALSASITTNANLTPTLLPATRLDSIVAADGGAIEQGILVVNEVGGAGAVQVDLGTADTVGDVVDLINQAAAAAGAGFQASLGANGLQITPAGFAVSVGDTSAGVVASALGIRTAAPSTEAITGAPLTPRLTRLTPVTALAGGAGIDLTSGFVIANGPNQATVTLEGAQTVQDIINAINTAGVYVTARINASGTGIDVFNQVSGTSLSIGENGGTTATDLGVRTFDAATLLSQLNFGRGIHTVAGQDDFTITAKDGSTVNVNLDGAITVGDVIELINTAAGDAGVSVTASFAGTGNGILLSDGTGGSGALSVSIANLSTAAIELGLVKSAPADSSELLGDDVNPTRTEGILGALVDLETALRQDDTNGISFAGNRLDGLRNEVIRSQGIIGARSQGLKSKLSQMDDASLSTEQFLSQVKDLDFTEAATKLQSALTQFQANLQVSSQIMGVSLLDYLS